MTEKQQGVEERDELGLITSTITNDTPLCSPMSMRNVPTVSFGFCSVFRFLLHPTFTSSFSGLQIWCFKFSADTQSALWTLILFMNAFTHMHACMHACTHARTHTHTHTHTHTCTHTHTHTHAHPHPHLCAHTHTHTTHTCTTHPPTHTPTKHPPTHPHPHPPTHTHTHTKHTHAPHTHPPNTHPLTHTHTHTETDLLQLGVLLLQQTEGSGGLVQQTGAPLVLLLRRLVLALQRLQLVVQALDSVAHNTKAAWQCRECNNNNNHLWELPL